MMNYIALGGAFPVCLFKTQGVAVGLGYIRLTAGINATRMLKFPANILSSAAKQWLKTINNPVQLQPKALPLGWGIFGLQPE